MKSYFKQFIITGLTSLLLLLSSSIVLASQDDPVRTRLRMAFFQEDYQTGWLEIKASYREGKRMNPVPEQGIVVYLVEDDEEQLLGETSTDMDGKAIFQLNPETFSKYLRGDTLSFNVILTKSDRFRKSSKSVSVSKAILDIELNSTDSIKQVIARLYTAAKEGELMPLASQDIKFYVKRYFSMLPIGSSYNLTDENGEISTLFPQDLPGNKQGTVHIIVRLEDHEEFGTITMNRSADWGVPLKNRNILGRRTLWSTREKAPYFLLFLSNFIILLTWGSILYLAVQLVSIHKIGKTHQS